MSLPKIKSFSTMTMAIQTARAFPNIWTLPRAINLDWAYAVADKRDLRLDLLRGFAVFAMVVDHFGGSSWLYLVTGGNTFFVSAAEGFVFLSGLVVGMIYGGIALKEGLRVAQVKAWQRAFTLYKLSVALTLIFASVTLFFNLPWSSTAQVSNPIEFVLNVVLLRQTMYLTDVMLMYTLLMALAPIGLWLLVKGRAWLLLSASGALWLAFQFAPAQINSAWQIIGNTTFNVAAWQLLFFVALAVGFHRKTLAQKLGQLPRVPYLLFLGLLLLWLTQLHATNGAYLARLFPGLDPQALINELFSKSALAPGRLIASAVVFQFAYLLVTLIWKPVAAAFGWLLLPLGQNSLYSYTMHVAVIGAFYVILPYLPGNIPAMGTLNMSLQLLAILAIWGMIQKQFLFKIVPR